MNVEFLPAARDDLEDVFDYYQTQASRLGDSFLEAFRRGVDRIIEHPHAWRTYGTKYRCYRLHHFQYGIIYRIFSERILIEGVVHMKAKGHERFN